MKVEKRITIFPQKFKSVTLTVSDVTSFEDADEILRQEIKRYIHLLDTEDVLILEQTIGGFINDRRKTK
jgi:mannose/fructose-specific phosphotransferase system component IIA